MLSKTNVIKEGTMKVISLANQKGGVAKTTSTYNLAAARAMMDADARILMIDLDPQASLTISADIEPGDDYLEGHSVCDLFEVKKDPLDAVFSVRASGLQNLYIVPSDIELAEMEVRLITRMFGAESLLKKALDKMEDCFDYVFIDCPPQLGKLTVNALIASDEVIIPTQAGYLPMRGLKALLKTIEEVKTINTDLEVKGIIITMYESRINDQQDIKDMLEEYAPILGTVRKSADVQRKVVAGKPVVISMPQAQTAREYMQIAEKL